MSEVRRYRKKPVVIEAMGPLTASNMDEIAAWCGRAAVLPPPSSRLVYVTIDTLEGRMVANEGDFIIRGVQGEFYPCKPDIFAATYEEVVDDE